VGRLLREGRVEAGGRVVRLEEVSEARPGQAFALVMDTRICPGAEALARGADLLVSEATYQADAAREAHERFHLTAAGAAGLAARAGARRLGLTHFSQRYATLDGFRAEAEALHPDVFCAGDLDRLEVPPRLFLPSPLGGEGSGVRG
jgi:ribonuclease Z